MTDPTADAQSASKQASDLLSVLADQVPAMIAYCDANQHCQFANRAYERWLGLAPEAIIGRHARDFLGSLYALNQPYILGALRGEAQEFEREIPDPAGGPARHGLVQFIPDVVRGQVRGFGILGTDITRLKGAEAAVRDLERQLGATERLAALATLAASIGHEINNPLASVLANIELTLESLDRGTPDLSLLREELVAARDGARHMGTVVRSMSLLVRGDMSTRDLVDVPSVLKQSVTLAGNAIVHRARLLVDVEEVGSIEGNATQLAQVCVNLLVNAVQALPEANPERNQIQLSARRDGGDILIEIADNGCGIPEHLRARIFDPFFTTKEARHGVGLGLSISSGLVHALGGSISVTSRVGEGSVFRIVLPAAPAGAKGPPEAAAPGAPPAPSPRAPASPRLRVLVVDDQASLAQALQRMLARDHEVMVVSQGREAIALLSSGQPSFDVVLCDLMMPELSGFEVYAEVIKQQPEVAERFVFMTGGAFTPRGQQFLDEVRPPLLEKPFDAARVRELVRSHAARRRRGV